MQKLAKAFLYRLSRWKDQNRPLFFPTEEKTLGSNFGQLNIHMNLHSAHIVSSSLGPAEPAVFQVFLHHIAPSSAYLFYSQLQHALNIFLNFRGLLGYQTARSDSFTTYIYSHTQRTCMEHLLCARLVAAVMNNRCIMPVFRKLSIQQEKADFRQMSTQTFVSFQLS